MTDQKRNKKKSIAAVWISLILTVFLLAGCGVPEKASGGRFSADTGSRPDVPDSDTRDSHTVANIDGTEMEIPFQVERVAAVYGPAYEICAALGAEDRIVVAADVQFENFPWALKVWKRMSRLPYLENVHSSVSFEELQKYSPDLVLTFNRPNELSQLRRAGIAAVNGLTPRTLEDEKALVRVYAEALGGNAPERAELYADFFDRKLKKITDQTDQLSEEEKPAVYYAGVDLLNTYGNQSDLVEAVEAAGGLPVMKELSGGNHTAINYEQLAAWNPEYIFIDHGGMNDRQTVEDILKGTVENRRYQSISAVRDQQMYLVPSGTFYWDMGIQKILLIEYMAGILHPKLFPDLDMKTELAEFYSTFFLYDLTDEETERILNRQDPE